MRKIALLIGIAAALRAESGSFTIHMILHAIGEERYNIATSADGLNLASTFEYSDRGMKRSTMVALRMKSDYTPHSFEIKGAAPRTVTIAGETAAIDEGASKRSVQPPAKYFTIFGPSPFAVQMAMMRYWLAHGRPAQLPVLRSSATADPIRIEAVGRDSVTVAGKAVVLDRYTIANLMFGREILWMDHNGQLAAAMTFAGGLPMEAVRSEYEASLPQLYRAGVSQEMSDLAAIEKQVMPEHRGSFAIVGATLVDGTGTAPVADSIVIVRAGRIVSAGTRASVAIPRGMTVVDAKGKALLPGLWEMHAHFSGVEFGPALLAAGITTARDCGGEFDYLVAQRDAVEKHNGLGPRMLLAGLVDAGGAAAFGHITAETPDEGRTVVNRYHAAGFQQIKLYTFLTPEVISAITAEAHRLGMTVTGHVPRALNAFQGVEAGMDQINHLNYVSNMMRETGGRGAIDVNSEAARKAIAFFKAHKTVVDPTAGWGEMSGHSKEVDVASFEPGITKAPFTLESKFRGMGGNSTASQMRERMVPTIAVIGALFKAGVSIVPGTDTGLVGYGLDRELELYVQAGMTSMEAIQSATIVSARAMKLDADAGTIENGKRADLILVDGNPATNINDLRKVVKVVANGRMYDCGKLWESVGFRK